VAPPLVHPPNPVHYDFYKEHASALQSKPVCQAWIRRQDRGIRDSSVSSRANCCLPGVRFRCPHPVHTPALVIVMLQVYLVCSSLSMTCSYVFCSVCSLGTLSWYASARVQQQTLYLSSIVRPPY